jgi:FdhE protein
VTRAGPAWARVEGLLRDHADWAPYVAALREVARVLEDRAASEGERRWGALAASTDTGHSPRHPSGAPLLQSAVIEVDPATLDPWVRRLLRLACEHGGAAALRDAPRSGALDAVALVEAAIDHDGERLTSLAGEVGVAANALGAIAHLAATPLLHAARRAHESALPEYWEPGYCPVCGAFPTLAEVRGLERARRLRCARCGADWWTEWLRCSFCGNREHTTLGSLLPDGAGDSCRAETCAQCRAYVKTLSTLTAIPAAELGVEDLATVDLDMAALERGYRRPAVSGARLDARLVSTNRPARSKLIDHLGGLFRS